MKVDFKRVPAVDKCFAVLELLATTQRPMGISEIATSLSLNKSTVFNMVYTLSDLGVLANSDGKFRFGTRLYLLGKAAEQGSDLIGVIHPFLEEISRRTNLSVFLGMRSGLKAVILDKADSHVDLKISTDIGIRIPLLAGAGGKVLLCQLPENTVDRILAEIPDKEFSRRAVGGRDQYRKAIRQTREQGLAVDQGEYLPGIGALAVPLDVNRSDLQVGMWAVGFANQLKGESLAEYSKLLQQTAKEVEEQFRH